MKYEMTIRVKTDKLSIYKSWNTAALHKFMIDLTDVLICDGTDYICLNIKSVMININIKAGNKYIQCWFLQLPVQSVFIVL